MAVMVTFTLKTDRKTYESVHPQVLPLAISAGMLFHSAHEEGGEVGIVDFCPARRRGTAFRTVRSPTA